ncbi:hypothetical protein WICMUC_004316 [Wickerhamomyces mucosus]|uniref:Vta1 C-terminal domain-containing protein n=1 Tax=Wickerhamomyces mucosus TaxID=1378264 RepID=A0A9P8PJB4_9ASCO|nr:hypothetical protein WICMUC_004316 [Wickerhamomyces mucosus]
MSLNPPQSLPKDIQIYITRSNELSVVDPLISYFCKLYSVEQILNNGLHTSNEEISEFAMELLDKIEEFKQNKDGLNTENLDIINDKLTSISYILSFANGIFKKSLNQIVNQNSTKSTAISLLTSIQFFKILDLWNDEINEIEESEQLSKKYKYAKYHASRILKTLKNGENPNDYVPPVNDKELQDLLNEVNVGKQQKEEEEEEDREKSLPEFNDEPIEEPPIPVISKPEVDELGLPSAPKSIEDIDTTTTTTTNGDDNKVEKHIEDNDEEEELKLPEPPKTIKESSPSPPPEQIEPSRHDYDINKIIESGEVYSKATKHAKFAISAMNYEDNSTAINELTKAIELLKSLSG